VHICLEEREPVSDYDRVDWRMMRSNLSVPEKNGWPKLPEKDEAACILGMCGIFDLSEEILERFW
jgi:hypothetical protein